MSRLRLSIVYYLNSLPLSWGFMRGSEKGLFQLDFSPPSGCADLLAEGAVDIGLIPCIEYQRIPNLKIVPDLSVSAKTNVQSVLLLSKIPANQLTTVAVDSSSRTSLCLLKILLKARFRADPVLNIRSPDVNSMLREHDAALIIGDQALRAKTDGLYVYDLADEWFSLVGKPFVFAFWAVRGSVSLPDCQVFQKSYQFGLSHLRDISVEQSQILGLSEQRILDYLTKNIDYSLDQDNLEGLLLFYKLAREYRLISLVRELDFV